MDDSETGIKRNEKQSSENSKKEPVVISVIICTYNRADLLRPAILSVQNQNFSKDDFELVVVDNNCTDSTRIVVEELRRSLPELSLVYITEREQGLSPARNAGVKAATGEIIAFMDDDSEADPDWLRNLQKIYEEYPDAASVGGKILPQWVGTKPEWFSGNAENICKLDRGDEVKEFLFPEHPFGGNLSIRKDIFLSLGGFNPMLGRKHKGLLSNEEKEFYFRFSNSTKLKVLYAPDAVVFHKAFSDKLSKPYVVRRFYWQGKSEALFDQITQNRTVKENLVLSLLRTRRISALVLKLLKKKVSRKESIHLDELIELYHELGMCKIAMSLAIHRLFLGELTWKKFS